MLTRIQVDDYDAWKQVEFDSPDAAATARDRLVASGVLDRVTVKAGPSVADVAETVQY